MQISDLILWRLFEGNRPISMYIKIQSKTKDLSTRLWGITTDFVGFISQSLMLRSTVLGWILIYWNWSIQDLFSQVLAGVGVGGGRGVGGAQNTKYFKSLLTLFGTSNNLVWYHQNQLLRLKCLFFLNYIHIHCCSQHCFTSRKMLLFFPCSFKHLRNFQHNLRTSGRLFERKPFSSFSIPF